MTATYQAAARAAFASRARTNARCWDIVPSPVPGERYDFQCYVTGEYGQCWTDDAGNWLQAPRGTAPVLLAYKGR